MTRSLLVGLALIWLVGVVASVVVLQRLIERNSDRELHESATILLSLVAYTDDLLVTAAVLGERAPIAAQHDHERFLFQVRDASGRLLLHAPAHETALPQAPLVEGFATVGDWRVVTLADPAHRRFVQLADSIAERRDALVTALLWLTLPLAALLAFAAYIAYRASRSLARQVEATAGAVARQDPQALGRLPLDGVVTEMRPAVEAANELLARLSAALEAERSFTYNSAHELRTPIAAAIAQAQLLAARTEGTPYRPQVDALLAALNRLARLAERLLALARAEGGEPLSTQAVDLSTVVRLTAAEFERDARLGKRELVADVRGPCRVTADLDAAGLALRNLVENAIQHARGASRIVVACGTEGGRPYAAVVDDGAGCEGDPARLVQRFVRGGGRTDTGAGLGLSIVDTLARRMGARLVLASPAPGQARGFEARIAWPGARETGGDAPRARRASRAERHTSA